MSLPAGSTAKQGLIARPAVARRLSAALDRGSLLLIAPAGSGKTMALEEALADRGGDVGRIGCTALDRHAGRLLDRVVEVLRLTVPGAADVLADMLARERSARSARTSRCASSSPSSNAS